MRSLLPTYHRHGIRLNLDIWMILTSATPSKDLLPARSAVPPVSFVTIDTYITIFNALKLNPAFSREYLNEASIKQLERVSFADVSPLARLSDMLYHVPLSLWPVFLGSFVVHYLLCVVSSSRLWLCSRRCCA